MAQLWHHKLLNISHECLALQVCINLSEQNLWGDTDLTLDFGWPLPRWEELPEALRELILINDSIPLCVH